MGLLKVLIRRLTGALVVRVCHTIQPVFDDPNLVAFGGLPAVMRLAEQAGLHDLVEEHVTVPGSAGSNAAVKVPALVAGTLTAAFEPADPGTVTCSSTRSWRPACSANRITAGRPPNATRLGSSKTG